MRFLLATALKDLRRRARDRVSLAIWLGVPVLIGGLMSLVATGGDGGGPTIRLLLVDEDDSLLSGLLAGAGGGELGERLVIEEVELAEGRQRMDAGEATAMLVLPEGLGQALLEETPATLELVTNPAQRVLPRIVREGLEMLVEAAFYAQRVLGEPIRELVEGAPPDGEFYADATVAAFSGEINRRLRRLDGVLFPPVLQLADEPADGDGDEGGGFDFGLFFLPGLLMMALLFVAHGFSEDLWQEKRQGALVRAASAPHGPAVFLWGKLLAGVLLMAAVALVGLLVGVVLFGLEASRAPLALVWCALAGVTLLALFFPLQLVSPSQRAGNVVTTVLLFPLMMMGGSFFPFGAMPDWMAAAGRRTPNGLAVTRLSEILAGQASAGALLVSGAVLLLASFLLVLVSTRLFTGRFLRA